MSGLKFTPLRDEHMGAGAKMVDFAGWQMPVEFKGVGVEHQTVREKVGVFDVSHMGNIRLRGPNALASVEWLTTNEVGKLKAGQAQYSLLLNQSGGVVDDIIVYCLAPKTDYLFCVNASNIDKDLMWIAGQARGAEILDESSVWGQIAVQGPRALELIAKIFPGSPPEAFEFRRINLVGLEVMIARVGFTGEDGVEIFVPAAQTVILWRRLLEMGKPLGAEPIGLGARDSLRIEMKYPLYGHELNDTSNPYAADLGWAMKPDKKDFVGRSALMGHEKDLARKLIGFKMREEDLPLQGDKLFSKDGKEAGYVTSGTFSPTLNENIGLGYLDTGLCAEGTEIAVESLGLMAPAVVAKTPFIKP
jgi:aminomethyltransferase